MGDHPKQHAVKAFSTGEAARFCYVTSETIQNWIRSGRLPAQRTAGGQYRIRVQDLRAFMEESGMDTGVLDERQEVRPDCWEFHGSLVARFGSVSQEPCVTCLVRRSGTRNCWELHGFLPLTARRHSRCEHCSYFRRYAPASRGGDAGSKGDPEGSEDR
jgi:excisionase family DNA binding protein